MSSINVIQVFDFYFSGIVAMQFHPGVKSRLPLDELVQYAMIAVSERDKALQSYDLLNNFCLEDCMANPFEALVRMVSLKVQRQEQALAESKLQLEAAISARAAHEDGDKPDKRQADIVTQLAADGGKAGRRG